jgi:hypothetical protein
MHLWIFSNYFRDDINQQVYTLAIHHTRDYHDVDLVRWTHGYIRLETSSINCIGYDIDSRWVYSRTQ